MQEKQEEFELETKIEKIKNAIKPLYDKVQEEKYGELLSYYVGDPVANILNKPTIGDQLSLKKALMKIHKASFVASNFALKAEPIFTSLKQGNVKWGLLQPVSVLWNKKELLNDIKTFFEKIGVKNYNPNTDKETFEKQIEQIIGEETLSPPKPGMS